MRVVLMRTKSSDRIAEAKLKFLTPNICMVLVEIDKCRNVTDAATKLGKAQSYISKQLSQLEDKVGSILFNRSSKGIEPTQEGEVLVRWAKYFVAGLTSAQEELDAVKAGNAGHINIGVGSVSAPVLLPRSLLAFREKHHNIKINIRHDTSDRLLSDLEDRNLDIVVARLPSFGLMEYETHKLADNEVKVVASKNHPLKEVKNISWKKLTEYDWIVPESDNTARIQLEHLLEEQGLKMPSGFIETMSLPVITSLVRKSNLITFYAQDVAEEVSKHEGLSILDFKLELKLEPICIIVRKNLILSHAMRELIETIKKTSNIIHNQR